MSTESETLEPGTRVRSTEPQYPTLKEGTYRGFNGLWDIIDWDDVDEARGRSGYLHNWDEFEVIE